MIGIVGISKLVLISCKINLHFYHITKLALFPIFKGFIMAFCLSLMFLLFFYFIVSNTYFIGIAVTFGDSSTNNNNNTNWSSYAGRLGLSLFFVGYFLLSNGISQSFKVPTP